MVVLLQDPVERTISQLFHARNRGFERSTPQPPLPQNPSVYKAAIP